VLSRLSYTAFSPRGPRIALAASEDLFHWKRLGLAKFVPANGMDFDEVDYTFEHFTSHHRLASPASPWERLKIGAGTPPIRTRHGWLILYHGVSEVGQSKSGEHHLCYSAGLMFLSKEHPQVVLYRSAQPVLAPLLPQERQGTIANVVFPTGIDRRDDLGLPDRFDIYYGMADNRIGVARLGLPEQLSQVALVDPPEAKV